MNPIDNISMDENFLEVQKEYLRKVCLRPPEELEKVIPAHRLNNCFRFHAFGESCELHRDRILLGGQKLIGPEGILIALYALHAVDVPVQLHPLKSFKELPESMPYQGAFVARAEQVLHPYVTRVRQQQKEIISRFSGYANRDASSGDFSFILFPLPRIPLYYIFYLSDDEFPAGVNCLFAANATHFMPVAGLADLAEFTAKRIIQIMGDPSQTT